MLLALSVLGGLAMPNTPHAPSYAAGDWGRYFPVEYVAEPKAPNRIRWEMPEHPDFVLGDLSELSVEDKRLLVPDLSLSRSVYNIIYAYRLLKNGTVYAAGSTEYAVDRGTRLFRIADTANGQTPPVTKEFKAPTLITTHAANGITTAYGLRSSYGGSVTSGAGQFLCLRVQDTDFSMVFYYHHARKGAWRVDVMALQTPEGRRAVIDCASQQFFVLY